MATLTVEVPDEAFAAVRNNPDQFVSEMRLAVASALYERSEVSQEIAAQVADLARADFLLALASAGKDSFQVDFADLDRELERVNER
jgi:predicted HTH domain antitoxin